MSIESCGGMEAEETSRSRRGRWGWLWLTLLAVVAGCDGGGEVEGDEGGRTASAAMAESARSGAGTSSDGMNGVGRNSETGDDMGRDERAEHRIAIEGVGVGHWTSAEGATGCTVVLAEEGVVAGVDVRGGGPASRETDLLRPENMVQEVHAVLLCGGSAFGLDAAAGVMRYLEERGKGFSTRSGVVPIVSAVALYDLGLGGHSTRPGADGGFAAAQAASSVFELGSVGAGAGATVGKLRGLGSAMRGGLGASSLDAGDGVTVTAVVAVNAVGDIIDPSNGRVVAGQQKDGTLLDARKLVRQPPVVSPGENTTLAVVVTNAALSQAEATKVAQMAQDGLARAIYPSHTPWDGDAVFVLASGSVDTEVDLIRIGTLAADAVEQAILVGVRSARGGFGLLSARDLGSAEAAARPSDGGQ